MFSCIVVCTVVESWLACWPAQVQVPAVCGMCCYFISHMLPSFRDHGGAYNIGHALRARAHADQVEVICTKATAFVWLNAI